MALDIDLRRNTFSGIVEIDWDAKELKESLKKRYWVEVDLPAVKLINGGGRSARLIGREMVDMVCRMARTQGIAIVGLYNSTYHFAMGYYARRIACEDLIGIVSANGGPSGVTPHNGSRPVTGTNPLAYGVPTSELPIVFDAATSQYPYGTISLAKQSGSQLPESSYVDAEGNFTTNPHKAIGIIPFGGHRGYAINLMLEVLTGALVRAKMGLQSQGEQDLGSMMIAINPAAFQPLEQFKMQMTQLVKDIEGTPPLLGDQPIRVPGYRSEEEKRRMIKDDCVEVSDETWTKYQALVKKHTGVL